MSELSRDALEKMGYHFHTGLESRPYWEPYVSISSGDGWVSTYDDFSMVGMDIDDDEILNEMVKVANAHYQNGILHDE